jgi:hypothetical protein
MTMQPRGHQTLRPSPIPDRRYSDPVALWCPYCHQSFVGTVDRGTGRFVHGTCPVGRLDLAAIRELAVEQWFWARFLERLGIALPPGAVPTGPAPRATHRRTAA